MANPKSLKNLKPFRPGESGNPAGAKPGPRFKTVIKRFLELEAILDPQDQDARLLELVKQKIGRDMTTRELITVKQIIKAMRGDTTAFEKLADREEGKPVQPKFDEGKQGQTYVDFLESIATSQEDECDDESEG